MTNETKPREWTFRIDKLYDCSIRMTPVLDSDVETLVLKSDFEQACKERDEARVEIERLKISRYEEGRSSAAMDREEAIFSERKACALLAECEKALEFATENICRHTGELHPGNGREWCLACHSWVYKHDREGLELFDKTLTKLKARNTSE